MTSQKRRLMHLIAALDRPSGHIVVLTILVLIGCVGEVIGISWADRIGLGALTLLLATLTPVGRNRRER